MRKASFGFNILETKSGCTLSIRKDDEKERVFADGLKSAREAYLLLVQITGFRQLLGASVTVNVIGNVSTWWTWYFPMCSTHQLPIPEGKTACYRCIYPEAPANTGDATTAAPPA